MIVLTELAATKIKKSIDARATTTLGIKVGVKTAGCSGMSYVLEFVETRTPDDIEYVCYGVSVFTTAKDLVYLDGLLMDWERNGLNEGFVFTNPKEVGKCGCGESFTV
jgi:iron-sulfur cluster assembly protein